MGEEISNSDMRYLHSKAQCLGEQRQISGQDYHLEISIRAGGVSRIVYQGFVPTVLIHTGPLTMGDEAGPRFGQEMAQKSRKAGPWFGQERLAAGEGQPCSSDKTYEMTVPKTLSF